MNGFRPHKVGKQVALNPVARAVARANLAEKTLVLRIRLYMLEEGEHCQDIFITLARFFALCLLAIDFDYKGKRDTMAWATNPVRLHNIAIIDAQETVLKLSENGFRWDLMEYTIPIDNGLVAGQEVVKFLTPHSIRYAEARLAAI